MKPRWIAGAVLALVLTLQATLSWSAALDPFRFREAWLLERRLIDAGEGFTGNPAHYLRQGYSQAMQQRPDSLDVKSYRSGLALPIMLKEIDRIAAAGGFQEAERLYLQFAGSIQQAQGENASDIAFTLGHLGEFYLSTRQFEKAHDAFAEAVRIRRMTLDVPAEWRAIHRFHLAMLLTHFGQMDYACGDLESAATHLGEAVTLNDEPALAVYADSLDAAYFRSLVFERQKKWADAEKLWKKAVESRASLGNQPYRDAGGEMAAFYARRGDFHTAAEVVRRLSTELQGKKLSRAQPLPFWPDSDADVYTPMVYERLRDGALRLILAVDAWTQHHDPDAAMRYITNPFDVSVLDRGDTADRLRLLEWLEANLSVSLSILLDGEPTQSRVALAYTLSSGVKGRFLASAAFDMKLALQPPDPGNAAPQNALLADLANARESLAHLFASSAVVGQTLDHVSFSSSETRERVLMQALASPNQRRPQAPQGRAAVPEDTAFIDFVRWNRLDREHPERSSSEYGAFVERANQARRYVRLANAADVDADVHALERSMQEFHTTGLDNLARVRQLLARLYTRVLAPLEDSLGPVQRLLIVPDGELTLAPIDAFIDSRGHYFLESHAVSYLTSWRDLRPDDPSDGTQSSPALIVAAPNYDLVLAGDAAVPNSHRFAPLDNTAAEAASVAAALQLVPARILRGDEAREQLIKSRVSPAVIHFATHSEANLVAHGLGSPYDFFEYPSANNPFLYSAIALAGANRLQSTPEDGVLTALEISTMRLQGTMLAVLSSCQSGAGRFVNGQGIMGLRSAFFIAGVRSVVMNLWEEDDRAGAELMQDFYSRFIGTQLAPSFAEALRLARLTMLRGTRYQHPFFWSGYGHAGTFRSWTTPAIAPETVASFTPRCFEISGRTFAFADNLRYRIRVRLNTAPVRKNANDIGLFDIHLPGNEVEFDATGSTPIRASQLQLATLALLPGGMEIVVGNYSTLKVTLRGALGLPPMPAIPETLPDLTSFQSAKVWASNSATETVDYVGSCRASP